MVHSFKFFTVWLPVLSSSYLAHFPFIYRAAHLGCAEFELHSPSEAEGCRHLAWVLPAPTFVSLNTKQLAFSVFLSVNGITYYLAFS